jgi:Protein of unknown function (DUF2934)
MAIKKGPKPADEGQGLDARIREAAYHRWQEHGRPQGTALDDWLHAEASIAGAPKMKKIPVKKVAAKKAPPA